MEEYSAEYPEESTNRSFVIASIALGGIFVAGLLALGLYMFKVKPARISANATRAAEIHVSNTQVALDADATADAQMVVAEAALVVVATTPTSSPTDVPTTEPTIEPTKASTATPETAILVGPAVALSDSGSGGDAANTNMDLPTAIPIVAVAEASLPVAEASLPDAGFMDEVGLPILLVAALGLMMVILITRSIRHMTS